MLFMLFLGIMQISVGKWFGTHQPEGHLHFWGALERSRGAPSGKPIKANRFCLSDSC